jgi:KDO2-lipid IV(A) lauroyltransferase
MNLAQESLLQDLGRLVVWYPCRWLTRTLPLRTRMRLFEACGDLAFARFGEKRALLDRRLGLALPRLTPAQRQTAIQESFRNYFADRFLINLVPDLDARRIDRLACLEGEEHLRHALALGRGVVLVHAHFGPSQLPLIYLGYKGYRIAQMGLREPGETSAIGQATQRLRLRLEHLMPVTHFYAYDYLRPVLRWLGQGHILMTAGDGTGGGRRIGKFHPVRLLGHRFEMPLGAYRLAAAHQSPILTVIALRQRCGRYRLVIQPFQAIPGDPEGAQQQFVAWLEPYLAQAPGQWHFWDEWALEAGASLGAPRPPTASTSPTGGTAPLTTRAVPAGGGGPHTPPGRRPPGPTAPDPRQDKPHDHR